MNLEELLEKIAALEAENAKLRAVAEATQILLTSCCDRSLEVHGMLEVEDALRKMEDVS